MITEAHITTLELVGTVLMATGDYLKTLLHILMVILQCVPVGDLRGESRTQGRMRVGSGCCLWVSSPFFIEGHSKVQLDHKNS